MLLPIFLLTDLLNSLAHVFRFVSVITAVGIHLSSAVMELSSKLLVAFATILTVSGEILSPPYFDLAKDSTIAATATCGVNITTPRERFCRLTGASADERQDFFSSLYYSGNSQIIAGQLCDYCVAEGTPEADQYPLQVHSARFAIDGSEKWWQSPPLSRGQQFNDVNLTVSLGQV